MAPLILEAYRSQAVFHVCSPCVPEETAEMCSMGSACTLMSSWYTVLDPDIRCSLLLVIREMQLPAKVFEERYEDCAPETPEDEACGTAIRVVQRPQQFQEDGMLPLYFFETTGDLIYAGLRDGFRGEEFGGPAAAPRGASKGEILAGVRKILDIMVDRGYAIKASVVDVPGIGDAFGGFKVSIRGPANLWGLSALGARAALVANAFDVMAVAAWLRASGIEAEYELDLTETGVEEEWTLYRA